MPGVGLIAAAFVMPSPVCLPWLPGAGGVGAVTSGLFGYCPACAAFGRSQLDGKVGR